MHQILVHFFCLHERKEKSLKEQLLLLINLQKLDLAMSRINIKKKELPEKMAKMDEDLAVFTTGLEASRKRLDELNKRHAEKEDKLRKNIEALKKTKDRLFEVKTNKEYQAILKEIEQIEKKNSETEDEIIVTLEEMDQAKVALKLREKDYESYRSKYDDERGKIEGELKNLDVELLDCQQQSADFRKKVRTALLRRYETIKGINNGLAVISVWKEVCDGCHMNIPPQLYIELQKSEELLSCPNCHRIMYWYDREKNGA